MKGRPLANAFNRVRLRGGLSAELYGGREAMETWVSAKGYLGEVSPCGPSPNVWVHVDCSSHVVAMPVATRVPPPKNIWVAAGEGDLSRVQVSRL